MPARTLPGKPCGNTQINRNGLIQDVRASLEICLSHWLNRSVINIVSVSGQPGMQGQTPLHPLNHSPRLPSFPFLFFLLLLLFIFILFYFALDSLELFL